jgi:hypothetical protein
MNYIGSRYFDRHELIRTAVPGLQELMAFDETDALLLYEEVDSSHVRKLDLSVSFAHGRLGNGDILVIEMDLIEDDRQEAPYYSCIDWYDDISNRESITFFDVSSHDTRKVVDFSISKKVKPEIAAEKLSNIIGVHPSDIQFCKDDQGTPSLSVPTIELLLRQSRKKNSIYYSVLLES